MKRVLFQITPILLLDIACLIDVFLLIKVGAYKTVGTVFFVVVINIFYFRALVKHGTPDRGDQNV